MVYEREITFDQFTQVSGRSSMYSENREPMYTFFMDF